MHLHANFSLKSNPSRHMSSTNVVGAPHHRHLNSEPLLPN
jgi:hypothetical protein